MPAIANRFTAEGMMEPNEKNFGDLRETLGQILVSKYALYSHAEITDLLEHLCLPNDAGGSKRDRMRAAPALCPDEHLEAVARRALTSMALSARQRDDIQEILWRDWRGVKIPAKFRRDVGKQLASFELCVDKNAFVDVLIRFWQVEEHNFTGFFEALLLRL
jgi:hypothetical protein